ncbi:hypothetical protein ABIB15_000487 [Marisediminicola sp. UYEF4]|uniref:hypothetical protein n=1 Tax=Marisediminicola sp. UYEF4 TaxID=1756384 RepID=UPI0033937C35
MNSTLSTAPGRHQHPPPAAEHERSAHRPRDVAPIDRLALHVGLALIRWGRRPRVVRARPVDSEAAQLSRQNREGTIAREHAADLAYRLTIPFR